MIFTGQALFDAWPDHTQLNHGQLDDLKMAGLIATPWKATNRVKRKFTLPFFCTNRAEFWALRTFFSNRHKIGGQWVPLWMNDYRADALTPGASTIDIPIIGLAERFVYREQFGFLAVVSPTAIEPHEIASVAVVGNRERITLTEPL